jgi:hypothetical protein
MKNANPAVITDEKNDRHRDLSFDVRGMGLEQCKLKKH